MVTKVSDAGLRREATAAGGMTRTEDGTNMTNTPANSARSVATRERILVAAERLFAEHGVFAVSNRQVSEAAGQGNNAAVGYHFGTKTDLVRAIVHKHATRIEQNRLALSTQIKGSRDVRDWIICLVCASTDYYHESGEVTWYARFSAQVLTDPTLRSVVYDEALMSPSLQETLVSLSECLPDMPADVRRVRFEMARQVLVHMSAERERMLSEGPGAEISSWEDYSTNLVDALVGLWCAPVTR